MGPSRHRAGRIRAAILLGALARLRLAEACALRVCDVDFMRGIIHPRVPDKDESTKAVIDALVDSKFGDFADYLRTEEGSL